MRELAPFNGMRYAHKTIRHELAALEELAGKLGSEADGVAASLAERFGFVKQVINSHWAGEEEVLWPALEAKAPQITTPYTLDHQGEREVFSCTRQRKACQQTYRSGLPALLRMVGRLIASLTPACRVAR